MMLILHASHVSLIHVITLLLVRGVFPNMNKATFEIESSLSDKVCPISDILFESQAVSVVECVTMATGRPDCAGVGYHKDSGMCYGCGTVVDTGQFESLPGVVLYQRRGQGLTVYIAREAHVTYNEAESACSSNGGLARIDTTQKLEAIRSLLLDPNKGLGSVSYWVQCYRDPDNVWRFDDGAEIPVTNEFWMPGEPDPGGQTKCGYMIKQGNFYLDNYSCDSKFAYICEK